MNDFSYDKDFIFWCEQNSKLLREGNNNLLEPEKVAGILEIISENKKLKIKAKITNLMRALLRYQHNPKNVNASNNFWRETYDYWREKPDSLKEHRAFIEDLRNQINIEMNNSKSLFSYILNEFENIYHWVIVLESESNKINPDCYEKRSPFSLEMLLKKDYFPGYKEYRESLLEENVVR